MGWLVPLGGVVIILLGVSWVVAPQLIFRIRNWPGVTTEMEMKRGGELMYQSFGVLQILVGIAIILFSLLN